MSLFGYMFAGGVKALSDKASADKAQQDKLDIMAERARINQEYEQRIHDRNRGEALDDLNASHTYAEDTRKAARKLKLDDFNDPNSLDSKLRIRNISDAKKVAAAKDAHALAMEGLKNDKSANEFERKTALARYNAEVKLLNGLRTGNADGLTIEDAKKAVKKASEALDLLSPKKATKGKPPPKPTPAPSDGKEFDPAAIDAASKGKPAPKTGGTGKPTGGSKKPNPMSGKSGMLELGSLKKPKIDRAALNMAQSRYDKELARVSKGGYNSKAPHPRLHKLQGELRKAKAAYERAVRNNTTYLKQNKSVTDVR